MNFTIANMIGAIDKKFEQKYNYLISLLSKKISEMETIPPFTDLTLEGTWTNDSLSYALGYRVAGKTLSFRGMVTTGTHNTVISTLPVGKRPTKLILLSATALNPYWATIFINTDGTIVHMTGDTDALSLDGISFQLD